MPSNKRLYTSRPTYSWVRDFFNTRGNTLYVLTEADAYDFWIAVNNFTDRKRGVVYFGKNWEQFYLYANESTEGLAILNGEEKTDHEVAGFIYKNRGAINWSIHKMRKNYPEIERIESMSDAEIFFDRLATPFCFYDGGVPCRIEKCRYWKRQWCYRSLIVTWTPFYSHCRLLRGDNFIHEHREAINAELAKDKRSVAVVHRKGESK